MRPNPASGSIPTFAISGSDLLAWAVDNYPHVMRIVLTGRATAETAIRAVNDGKVYHFFTKPCDEVELALTIRRALEQKDQLEHDHTLLDSPQR